MATPPAEDKLEFFEAMRDFRKMFPTIEDEVIEAILRANNGAVDDTIDHLLVMSMEREQAPYNETIPKRVGDLPTASPRVDISVLPNVPHDGVRRFSNEPTRNSAGNSSLSPSLFDADFSELNLHDFSAAPRTPRKKKIYRPPLVGVLPSDFLRFSSTTDPWEKKSPRRVAASRRTISDLDYSQRHIVDGPPPSYAAATSTSQSGYEHQRHFEQQQQRSPYNTPRHTSMGVFRTSTMPSTHTRPQMSPRRSSEDQYTVRASELKEMMAENQWRRQVAQDPELALYLEDERVAILLQNDEFMHYLRNDRDFVTALDRDVEKAKKKRAPEKRKRTSSGTAHPEIAEAHSSTVRPLSAENNCTNPTFESDVPADPFPYTKTLPKCEDPERPFHEKVAMMGKSSQRKFATMARRFIRKTKGAKGVLDTRESYQPDARLLNPSDESDTDSSQPKPGAHRYGYNQSSDTDYNIGQKTDLKEGRLFSL